ncbi:MAG: EF-hand domain-containing protein [Henriciella sp.]|uniref:EF-hand domain-containing protein n=1 Tax=Henriciella sp. TaxID=1968823 RepID=UPI0032EF50B7
MKKLALAALIAGTTTVGVAGYAIAQPYNGGRGQMIEKMDTNGDGQITKAEVEAHKAQRFAEADANGDGSLSMAEMEAFRAVQRARRMEARQQAMFDRRDANGDGVISADEFGGRGAMMFDRLDVDDDDIITADEIGAMKVKRGRGKHGGDCPYWPEDGGTDQ